FACARRTPPRLSFPTRRSSDLTLVSVIPDDGFHKQQIDHAAELIFAAEVNLNRYRIGFQTIFKLLYDFKEISTGTVHLVDEYHTRNFIFVGLTPHGLGLRLHTGRTTQHHHSTIQYTQRAFNFNGEVDVPRGIDDVN